MKKYLILTLILGTLSSVLCASYFVSEYIHSYELLLGVQPSVSSITTSFCVFFFISAMSPILCAFTIHSIRKNAGRATFQQIVNQKLYNTGDYKEITCVFLLKYPFLFYVVMSVPYLYIFTVAVVGFIRFWVAVVSIASDIVGYVQDMLTEHVSPGQYR